MKIFKKFYWWRLFWSHCLSLFHGLDTAAYYNQHLSGSMVKNDDIAKAWHELSVSMEAAGAELMATVRGAHDKKEGFQALNSLLSAALEMKLTKGDPLRPAFTDWMSNHRKF